MNLPLLGTAIAALATSVVACSPSGDHAGSAATSRPDVVLLIVDGLRVDRLDALFAAPAVAPLALALAGGGVTRFERAYAPSSLAEQSLAALFSGRLPTHGGGIGLVEAQPAPEATTLGTRLRQAGYRTGLVSQQPWAARPGFTRGFDGLQVAAAGAGARTAVAEMALRIVAEDLAVQPAVGEARQPFLLVAHWAAPDLPRREATGRPMAAITSDHDVDAIAALSDAAALLSALAERDALARAVIVLTSSHGFELLDHGDVGSGFTLHEEVVRVPLLLRFPGAQGGRVAEPVSTVRLLPTLLALAGAEPAGADLTDDRSLLLPGGGSPREQEGTPVLAELVVRERTIARAVIEGHDKYLQVLREAPVADRDVVEAGYEELQAAMTSGAIATPALFGEPAREALLRLSDAGALSETPLELAAHAALLSRLRAVLRDYQRLCDATGFAPPAVTERMPIDPNDVRQLEALGYM
jgi:hypothetical protein